MLTDDQKAQIEDAVREDYEWLVTDAQQTEAWRGTTPDEIGPLDMPEGAFSRVLLESDWGSVDKHRAVPYARDIWNDLPHDREWHIREIAEDCADECVEAVADEHLDVHDPLPGDWEYAEQALVAMTDDEIGKFRRCYQRRLESHVTDEEAA